MYDDLESVFKDKFKYILTLAFYMAIRNNVVNYVNYWCEEKYNYLSTPLVNQKISEIFASITKKWPKRIIENEYITYDVTNIFSYSKSMDNVSFGYNRDGEDLLEIYLCMYTKEKSKLPIFYNAYNGSIIDKEHLIFMMKYTKELKLNNIKFVMNKGFYEKDNLSYSFSSFIQ